MFVFIQIFRTDWNYWKIAMIVIIDFIKMLIFLRFYSSADSDLCFIGKNTDNENLSM